MSHEQFKSYLQRDKLFLKELYESNSVAKSKKLLSFANDSQLTTLIKYIHFVANGEIKIKKKNFDSLGNRVFALVRKNFEKKKSTSQSQPISAKRQNQNSAKTCCFFFRFISSSFC